MSRVAQIQYLSLADTEGVCGYCGKTDGLVAGPTAVHYTTEPFAIEEHVVCVWCGWSNEGEATHGT